jgi:hypothetical protein
MLTRVDMILRKLCHIAQSAQWYVTHRWMTSAEKRTFGTSTKRPFTSTGGNPTSTSSKSAVE